MGMTREEVINELNYLKEYYNSKDVNAYQGFDDEDNEALDLAIEALEQEPCDDAISRQSIKQKLQEHYDFFVNAYGGFNKLPQNDKSRADEIINCIAMVVNEPAVKPQYADAEIQKMQEMEQAEIEKAYELRKAEQPKIGQWIKEEKEFIVPSKFYPIQEIVSTCSICNAHYTGIHEDFNYCPSCGAKMENKTEEFDNLDEMLEKLWNDTESEEKRMNIKLDKGAFEPIREHKTDAGLDLRTPEEFTIKPNDSYIIDTGVHIELPKGYYGKLESKSGLNVKHNIVCLGGTIDEPYRGSIVVKLYNVGKEEYYFNKGDKIVQLVIQPYLAPDIEYTDKLSETDRGDNGFGSTGK